MVSRWRCTPFGTSRDCRLPAKLFRSGSRPSTLGSFTFLRAEICLPDVPQLGVSSLSFTVMEVTL